ncbi:hypothetical protein [Salinicola sp. CPA57]|uniref:hypothetical protein n=1 Tax=Salinicola sp. CPA57 TaxID=1949080 RepID=UPI001E3D4D6B|nr:hypothetical protein [Salinicola sp. CPA57]
MQILTVEQGTPEWHAARLGIVTMSELKTLLVKGKGPDGFGAGAISYMHQLIGERIKSYLDRFPVDQAASMIKWLQKDRDRSLLEHEEFNWIENSDLVSDLVWIVLNDLSDKEINDECGLKLGGFDEHATLAFSRVEVAFPGSSFVKFDDRLNEILAFFDIWNVDIFYKRKLMGSLKEVCSGLLAKKLKLSWLDNRYTNQCDWAWEHLKKASSKQRIPVLPYEIDPLGNKQKYRSIVAFLTFWDVDSDAKEYFILKFKKAWDQKVYREKQKGRSPLNTYIAADVKKMLNRLASENDEKLYKTLERAIKKAYQEEFGLM